MENDGKNGRTHEPSLRELTSQLDGLKELTRAQIQGLKDLIEERDRLYKERAESQKGAIQDALTAAKEQTASSFAASKEAIGKAEESQRVYNQGHNDLSRKMEAQYALMVPQSEARLKWDSVDKAVEELRKDGAVARNNHQTDLSSLRTDLMKEIASLRESRSVSSGEKSARFEGVHNNQWVIGLAVIIGIALVEVIGKLWK